MGGPLIMKTARRVPDRVGAAASFHGGGLVTPNPTSPHLLIPKMKARLYIGIAANDDMTAADREGHAEAGVRGREGAG
jgi:carboxymethylenebutenolidase